MTTAAAPVMIGHYRLGRTLGVGSFGKVKLAEHEPTGKKVAVKILNRQKIKMLDMEEKVKREIRILKLFMHPHIIRLYEVIDTPTDIFVITEFSSGGELFDYIVERGRLSEDTARRFFQQIISGVEYCHLHMVAHRDLKPENLLLDENANVKIADFGLSNCMRDGFFLKTSCGSPNYAAPEVISGKLYSGPEVDVWSCGVIVYALLCGTLPFDDENIPYLFKKIKGGLYTLPSYLSEPSRDLISKMLIVDPLKRITIKEIRKHPWFQVRLPLYLQVSSPTQAMETTIDESILQIVQEKMHCPKEKIARAILKGKKNCYTAAYHLLRDSMMKIDMANMDNGATLSYEGTDMQDFDHRKSNSTTFSSLISDPMPILVTNPSKLPPKRRWVFGIITSFRNGADVMMEVYRALSELRWRWKSPSQYPYQVRVLVCSADDEAVLASQGQSGSDTSQMVKIGLQLYKLPGGFQLDVHMLNGSKLGFMSACHQLLSILRL